MCVSWTRWGNVRVRREVGGRERGGECGWNLTGRREEVRAGRGVGSMEGGCGEGVVWYGNRVPTRVR